MAKKTIGFKTPEERDNYIKDALARMKAAGGRSKRWRENDIIIRRESIYYWMGQGKSRNALRLFLADLWDCSFHAVDNYIKDALDTLAQSSVEKNDEYRTKMIEKLERVAEDAMNNGDRKSALAAYEQMSKLNGAYTQKVEADLHTDIKFKFGE